MPIRVLPAEVATRIAAGEVVERPASVIKELIENAIDAGSGEIRLDVQGGGRRRMRVLDDGCGIPADEVELAFARHSTSKLTSVDDLEHIRTLGFRGEALASIASVARLTLVTRAREEPIGTLLRLEGGQVVAREPSGRPHGTAITVEELFFNVPARRKFLRTERTERRHIDALVTRYAMAYPDLRLTLTHDGRTTFQTNGSGDLREVLVSVFGASNAAQMIKVGPSAAPGLQGDIPISSIQVRGYASALTLHRSNRKEITLFVNGRWVQDQRLTFAVIQAYHTLLMTGRYPLAAIKVELPPEDVDVNVHPTKTQVRFRDGDAVFRAVQRAVRRALMDQAPVPQARTAPASMDTSTADFEGGADWPGAWPTPEQVVRRAQLRAIGAQPPHRFSRPPDPQAVQFTLDLSRPAADGAGPMGSTGYEPGPTTQPAPGANQLPFLRVVGQLGLTYIVAEGPEGMFLVDQHAAHERVLYEKLMAEKAQARIATQAFLEPMTVELTAEGASLVEENLETLLALGFDVEPFGGNTALVRAVPATSVNDEVQALLDEIVADLQVGDEPLAGETEARIVRRVCKRGAIKAGRALSQQEMEELIRQLEACAAPRTCPHGRPTMIHLSAEQLAKEFGRLG
jgi:DNA mismatch repair protein MutL